MSEHDGGDMTGRRLRGPRSASASLVPGPLENNDLLAEILIRLPPLPSSLVRASVVCKRWHGVVSDPHFQRTFRAHHGSPPVLGYISGYCRGRAEFASVLDPPDQIPVSRFSLPLPLTSDCMFVRSHHGYVLISNTKEKYFLVWDPVTRVLRQIAFPRIPKAFGNVFVMDGGVVCSSTNHGSCHSDRPFQIVFVAEGSERFYAGCVYSSEIGAWGKLCVIKKPGIMIIAPLCPSTLFMSSLCFLLIGQNTAILEFDWSRQKLALVDAPPDAPVAYSAHSDDCQYLIAPAGSGGLSFICLKEFSVRVWKKISNCVGDATWILANTIELNVLLSLGPEVSEAHLYIGGLDEDANVMFKIQNGIFFMVNLESKCLRSFIRSFPTAVFKKLYQKFPYCCRETFSSFYTPPGMYVTGRNDEVRTPHHGA